MHSQKAYPYPQIVTGDDWHVLETTEGDSQPRTDNLNRQMYVPMDRECDYCGINHGRMIRRHELGHAKWSPKTMGKLMRGTRSDAIEALEEVRVNYLLGAKAKLTVHEYLKCKDEFTNEKKIEERIKNNQDLFDRNIKYEKIDLDETFPSYIIENKSRFKNWIV